LQQVKDLSKGKADLRRRLNAADEEAERREKAMPDCHGCERKCSIEDAFVHLGSCKKSQAVG
jgi:uncharacterized Fe-S radical SAM superfamily protein PflX